MANIKTLEIYGPIGEGENTPEAVSRKLKTLGVKPGDRAELLIDSPGGDVFMGNAMFNILLGANLKWTIHVVGVAASMASLIATLPGARVIIAENAFIMIHDPAAWTGGGSKDLARTARLLDSIRDGMAKNYARRSGLPLDEILALMTEETWFDADTAVAKGFADEKGGAVKMAAHFDLRPFGYRRVPPTTAPKTMAEVAANYWAGQGKQVPEASVPPHDDCSDLVPKVAPGRVLTANFHGKYAGRRG